MTNEEREKAIEVFENANKCLEQRKKFKCDYNCDKCTASKAYSQKELEKPVNTALEALKQEPREHGEWIETGDVILWHKGILLFECQCSKCKGLAHFRKESLEHKLVGADFCPCCGANMRKEQK